MLLEAQKTRSDPPTRAQVKFRLMRKLFEQGYAEEAIVDLIGFIDWMLRLPEDLDIQVWQQFKEYEEEGRMTYISYPERMGLLQGRQEGLQKGKVEGRIEATRNIALQLATKRFGTLSEEITLRINSLAPEKLDDLALAVLDFKTVTDLADWLMEAG